MNASAASSGAATGSGTTNYVARWTPNGTTLGIGTLYDNGTQVGIGTTSPGALLTVSGNIGTPTAFNSFIGIQVVGSTGQSAEIELDGIGNSAAVEGVRYDGIVASPTALQLNDQITSWGAVGYNGTALSANQAIILMLSGGSWSTSSEPTYMSFGTTPIGSTSRVERMRINTTGNIGIGLGSAAALLNLGGAISAASWTTTGIDFATNAATYTDTSTAASGTVATRAVNSHAIPTLAATNTGVTVTNAANLYIAGAPAAGANVTIINPLALEVEVGTSYFGGSVGIGTTSPGSSLQVSGGAAVGYATSTAAPTKGLAVSGNVAVGTTTVPTGVTAAVNGVVKVAGTGSETCGAAQVGSIRYNSTGNYFELCSFP